MTTSFRARLVDELERLLEEARKGSPATNTVLMGAVRMIVSMQAEQSPPDMTLTLEWRSGSREVVHLT